MGVARPSEDPNARAAFFLANDLALILLRNSRSPSARIR